MCKFTFLSLKIPERLVAYCLSSDLHYLHYVLSFVNCSEPGSMEDLSPGSINQFPL